MMVACGSASLPVAVLRAAPATCTGAPDPTFAASFYSSPAPPFDPPPPRLLK